MAAPPHLRRLAPASGRIARPGRKARVEAKRRAEEDKRRAKEKENRDAFTSWLRKKESDREEQARARSEFDAKKGAAVRD